MKDSNSVKVGAEISLKGCFGYANHTPHWLCAQFDELGQAYHVLASAVSDQDLPAKGVLILTSTSDLWSRLRTLTGRTIFVLDNAVNLSAVKGITACDYTKLNSYTFTLKNLNTKAVNLRLDQVAAGKGVTKISATGGDLLNTMLDTLGATSLEKVRAFLYTIRDPEMRGIGQHALLAWMAMGDKPGSLLEKKLVSSGIEVTDKVMQELFEFFSTTEGKNVRAAWSDIVKSKNQNKAVKEGDPTKALNYASLSKKYKVPASDLKYLSTQYARYAKAKSTKPFDLVNVATGKKEVPEEAA